MVIFDVKIEENEVICTDTEERGLNEGKKSQREHGGFGAKQIKALDCIIMYQNMFWPRFYDWACSLIVTPPPAVL